MLEDARTAAGLSQAALAAAAGVSRQAVSAIEAGRHRPGIDAALAIAAAVGRPVEELFGAGSAASVAALGDRLENGAPVLAARVGDRLVHAPPSRALGVAGWPAADGVFEHGGVRPLPGAELGGVAVAGCDPALAIARDLLPGTGARRLLALSASSDAAVTALREGRLHGALVHAARPPRPPRGCERVGVARWSVGLAQRGRHPRSLAELCASGARIVQREPGAASQRALLAAAAAAGAPAPRGPRAAGHLEVAQRVAAGGATAGVTMEPAALALGLAFEALEEHTCELWVAPAFRDHPGVRALAELLRAPAFTRRLALVRGYEAAA